ncbi:glycosyltransferase family 4 protein [Alkalicoccobacillus plakortidis]|uniref:Glycosyltransferase family 4 protein n=1 Tax=Alkalicoccobacillus plakortidis TaxID=444060 RepID=A0ABT0XQ36_9BACI|nr:glycosyltransferase family 4 protein [Alkalicoccobacillus plakortidis]MCM2677805.1 glycosyltransferase family 4 protein [Alkalicoccobacillus plakortidis]
MGIPPCHCCGLSIHVSHLAHELAKKSYEVHVLTSYVDGLPSHQEENGVHVHRVQGLNPHAASFNDWIGGLNFAMVKAGEELAKTQKIDLIHAHDWLVSVAAIGLKQKLQLPLLATIHATESGRINGSLNSRQEMIRLKEERLMHEAKQIIVCSQSMKRELTHDYRMSKNKISIIPNASRVSQSTNSDSLSQTQINSIYCFGRLVPEKGFQILLQALHLLKDRNKSVHVTIAGEGPYKESLERMAKELDVSNRVSFVGFLEPEECLRQLEKADIVVIPSLYEPFGLAALEAMSSAKAVIASKVGGLVELVTHNQTGLLVEPGDARDLATQLERLVDNSDEVKKLGQEAATHVFETYSLEKTAQLTIEQMNRMIKERTVSIN